MIFLESSSVCPQVDETATETLERSDIMLLYICL